MTKIVMAVAALLVLASVAQAETHSKQSTTVCVFKRVNCAQDGCFFECGEDRSFFIDGKKSVIKFDGHDEKHIGKKVKVVSVFKKRPGCGIEEDILKSAELIK
jgi:hypothetical protein